uniref:ADP-ribosyl cyclase/cyclic ADP-ribose hydrolase n=1 Tax=Cajanus cajan TaxID=3821 RepID=A0A151TL06_CAJCA|nr:TMV resistance protein N [Cajanus cajan]
MACIRNQRSSSSQTKNFDVFVSFRGTDTRNNFTGHLFAALERKGIVAFKDDQKIKKGELLEPELLQAIEGSRVFIVVFSKDYASSTWCMKELQKIVDWVQETARSVLPVFYDVTPSEVRKQSGKFGEAFAKHEERFKDDLEMVQIWREALKTITNRCGWDVQNKPQHEEIEKIVEEVINLLGHNQILSFEDDLVDMDFRVKQLEELLDLDVDEVARVIGICGMGGIGKTTLATALLNKISPQFDACCFIDDINKIYENFGPTGVQKKLLCQVLNQGNIEINNIFQGTMLVRTRLCHLKSLIFLDNVDQVEQLEKLALHPKYLGAGSRILIISRNSHILRNYGVDKVHNVQLLNTNKALQLFCRKAFKSDDILNDYEQLTYDALKYAGGLPLAIKVLGSDLFDRDIYEWRSALARLKENPNSDIMDVLRISFDGLKEMEKEIFLDIACFFSSENRKGKLSPWYWMEDVKKLLDYRGFYPDIGMKVLIEKSLISCKNRIIQMHDLLKELGRTIVREKSPKEPIKWTRLWDGKDLHNIMIKNKVAKNLEAIVIEQHPPEFQETTLPANALSKMNHLKLVILQNGNFSGSLDYLSNELRYLYWDEYPSRCLPSSFYPEKIVELLLPCSNIKQLWYLPNLIRLDLRYSKNLTKMPDLRGVPRLRYLNLCGCIEIVWMDPSIGILRELVFLSLRNCKKLLIDLNIIFGLNSLEVLDLAGCSKLLNTRLLKKPKETEHLEKVDTNKNAIQLSTSSVYEILMLPFNFLSNRKHEDSLGSLVPYLPRFSCLLCLNLSLCELLHIPDAIGNLHSLQILNLGGNKFVRLPTTIKELSNLYRLNLEHCKQLKYLPELPKLKETKSGDFFGELYIFSCHNLNEMEHCHRIVFCWMTQIFKAILQSSLSMGKIEIIIPGTQIPRWFSEQNVGSSISMDLSHVMEDPNWIAVAFCAMLVAHHDDSTNLNDRWQPDDSVTIGYSFQNNQVFQKSFWVVPTALNIGLITGEIDHLYILFLSRERLIDCRSPYEDEISDLHQMGFTMAIFNQPKDLHFEVKNCGYRCVFKEDLEQLNLNMMFSGNSSSSKCKLLTSD